MFDDFYASALGDLDPVIRRKNELEQEQLRAKERLRKPLSPQEEQSGLKWLANQSMNALEYAGKSLDKAFGGRAVRGVLGGNPREALSIIPFSDTKIPFTNLSLTDEKDRVSGRDLLENAGILERKAPDAGFQWDDLAGIAAEIALDPGTYLSFGAGAGTKAFKAAEALNILPKGRGALMRGFTNLDDAARAGGMTAAQLTDAMAKTGYQATDILNKPLGSLASVGLPFGLSKRIPLGTGPQALKVADRIDNAFKWLGSTQLGQRAKQMFNKPSMNLMGKEIQETAEAQFPFGQVAEVGIRKKVLDAFDKGRANLPANAIDALGPQVRYAAELGAQYKPPLVLAPDAITAILDEASRYRPAIDAAFDPAKAAGVGVTKHVSRYGSEYAPRNLLDEIVEAARGFFGGGSRRAVSTPTVSQMARQPAFDVPGAAQTLDAMASNPKIAGISRQLEDAAGNPIVRLNAAQAASVSQQLSRNFSAFPEADQVLLESLSAAMPNARKYMEIGGKVGRGMANRVEQAAYAALTGTEKQLADLAGRRASALADAQATVLQSMYGINPGDILRQPSTTGRTFAKSRLERLNAKANNYARRTAQGKAATPLTQAEADELLKLQRAYDETRHIVSRVRDAVRTRPMASGAADDLIRELQAAREGVAVERTIRQANPQFGLPVELKDLNKQKNAAKQTLAQAFGVSPNDPAAMRKLVRTTMPSPVMSPEVIDALQTLDLSGKTKYLGRFMGQLPDSVVASGKGIYNDILSDVMKYGTDLNRATDMAKVATGTIAKAARFTRDPQPGEVAVKSLLQSVAGRRTGNLKNAVLDEVSAALGTLLKPNDIKNLYVPEKIAKQITQARSTVIPEDVPAGWLGGMLDTFNNSMRVLTTNPFPANAVRNLTSSTFQNLSHTGRLGQSAAGYEIFRGGQRAAKELEAQAAKSPYYKSMIDSGQMTVQQAGRDLALDIAANRGFAQGVNPSRDMGFLRVANQLPGSPTTEQGTIRSLLGEQLMGFLPRSGQEALDMVNPYALLTKTIPNAIRNPETVRGVKAGAALGDAADTVSRGGMWLDLINQGFTPAAATAKTNAAHYTYSLGLTQFERDYMRRLIPFYGFTRPNIAETVRTLADNPGGLVGQSIRTSNALRGTGFMPEYLGGGLAIPLGGESEDGTQRYLTKLDLPYENALSMFDLGTGGLERTAMKLLGQTTPVIKGPLEFASNRQFYSGRELDDLYSRTGMPYVDQIAYNLPTTRYASTLGTLTDGRKGPLGLLINLGTGARVSDIDMNRERTKAISNRIERMLGGDANFDTFERLYVRPDHLPNMTPEEELIMRIYSTMERRQQLANKQRFGNPR